MTWPSQFLPVPSSLLQFDGPVLASPKASPGQLESYVKQVPEIYRRLVAGGSDEDFRGMVTAPLNDYERLLGQTYTHLFTTRPGAERLEAEYVEGRGLVVTRGRHRIAAAQRLGVPVMPVHVRARNEAQLSQVSRLCESQVARVDARLNDLHLGMTSPVPKAHLMRETERPPARRDPDRMGLDGPSGSGRLR